MSLSLEGFQTTQLKPGLFSIDILGDTIQRDSNHEWRRFGVSLAEYLKKHSKTAYLVSSCHLDTLLVNSTDNPPPISTFQIDDQLYFITELNSAELMTQLPDITESEEFIVGNNTWLCLSKVPKCVTLIEEDMKKVTENLCTFDKLELRIELLAAVSDGLELYWFNP
ncbi:hypothetical protein CAEBREN_25513 [Caenorhabditis brenneri]|uniref:Uncharacterized protein n=1 Tax=Caenorhabditis brenneri TaxID=135651 RepID=G0PKR2_CAEBE|nr:hypothetical protein CAEBREN_25513 [Caenorhabditis brenneri]